MELGSFFSKKLIQFVDMASFESEVSSFDQNLEILKARVRESDTGGVILTEVWTIAAGLNLQSIVFVCCTDCI